MFNDENKRLKNKRVNMAKNYDAEKKIVELLKEEVAHALAGAELVPGRLGEFGQFLDSFGGVQGGVEEFITRFNQSEFVSNIDTKKFAELLGKPRMQYSKSWKGEVASVLNRVKNEVQELESGGFDFIQQDKSQVTFVGYSVKVSGVARFISTVQTNVSHIRIFALDNLS